MYQDLKSAIDNYDIEKVKYFLKSIEEDGNLDDEAVSKLFKDVVFSIYMDSSEEETDTRIEIVKYLFEVHKQTNILTRLVKNILQIEKSPHEKKEALYYLRLFIFFVNNGVDFSDIETRYNIGKILIVTCMHGDIILLKYLHNYFNNIDVNFIISDAYFNTTDNNTMLNAAISKENLKIITYLLKHKADVDMEPGGFLSYTPLNEAIHQNNFDIVKLLLEYGAMPNTKERPLLLALKKGNFKIVKILLEYGAIFKQSDFVEVLKSKNIEIVKLFINNFKIDKKIINDAFKSKKITRGETIGFNYEDIVKLLAA